MNEIDFEDSWARVELYRWQYGRLPTNDHIDCDNDLDESKALLAIADAIEKGCMEQNMDIMPTPFNMISVLKYIAKKL